MVTAPEMRLFASDCVRWSDETSNASQRDLMRRIARTWMATACSVERQLGNHADVVLPDLRSKLNSS